MIIFYPFLFSFLLESLLNFHHPREVVALSHTREPPNIPIEKEKKRPSRQLNLPAIPVTCCWLSWPLPSRLRAIVCPWPLSWNSRPPLEDFRRRNRTKQNNQTWEKKTHNTTSLTSQANNTMRDLMVNKWLLLNNSNNKWYFWETISSKKNKKKKPLILSSLRISRRICSRKSSSCWPSEASETSVWRPYLLLNSSRAG